MLGQMPLRVLLDSVVPLAGDVRVVAAGGLIDADDVADVMARGGAPHRALRNSTFNAWDDAGRSTAGERPGEDHVTLQAGEMTFPRYSAAHPMRGMTGDIDAACLYAGTGVDRIVDCPAAADVIEALTERLPSD